MEDQYLFPVPLLPALLQSVNHLLTCGWCGESNYIRREISKIADPDLIVWYRLTCLTDNCKHNVLSRTCAMEAETLFEERAAYSAAS